MISTALVGVRRPKITTASTSSSSVGTKASSRRTMYPVTRPPPFRRAQPPRTGSGEPEVGTEDRRVEVADRAVTRVERLHTAHVGQRQHHRLLLVHGDDPHQVAQLLLQLIDRLVARRRVCLCV